MNARGNAVLGALATVVGLGVVSTSMVAYHENFVRTSRVAFARSAFTSFEGNVRYMTMQPYAYTCTDMSAIDTCRVNPGYFSSLGTPDGGNVYRLRRAFDGAKCPAAQPNCGFVFEFQPDLRIVQSGGKSYGMFQGKLTYEGEDASIPPVLFPTDPNAVLRESIPVEVLQAQVIDCNLSTGGERPVFAGFNGDGSPNCVGFDRCDQSSYVGHVNFDTLKVTCQSMNTPDKTLNCSQASTGQRQTGIVGVNWAVTDGQVSRTCRQMPQAPMNEAVSNCPENSHQEPNGSCSYSNRWCTVGQANGVPTLGFAANDPGARHPAGCGGPNGRFYPVGAVIPDGGGNYRKCMSGPYDQYPLPDSFCPGTTGSTCPDQVFQDVQQVSSHTQNGYVDLTVNFQSAVNSIPANCTYSSVTLDLWQFGNYFGRCQAPATFNLTPGGGPGYYGFASNKTNMVTAVVNGGQAYLTDRVAGFGSCGGNQCAACLSDVRVTVHSVPK